MPGLAGALVACSPPPKPQTVEGKADGGESRSKSIDVSSRDGARPDREQLAIGKDPRKHYEELARKEGKTLEEVTPPDVLAELRRKDSAASVTTLVPPEAPEAPPGPFPGDPPFIDGYNPEEETCVSGNWCGSITAAEAVAVPAIPAVGDCPSRLTGGKSTELIKADPKTYAGLSSAPNMQGNYNEHGTELARARTGKDDTCCYHWFEYCSGRPHLDEDGPVLAPVRAGDAWAEPSLLERPEGALPEALRQRLAEQWREDARAEHASVAAFARATLELMALGAPPELLAQAQRAGLDEIDHARRCFGLAARYDGEPVQPGPLPALAPRPAELARLAADTFAEGCVGETIAALVAHRAASRCTDPEVRRCLEVIADDEARHAALAWSTIAWARHEGGASVDERLREVAQRLRAASVRSLPPADPEASSLAVHGRLDARAQAQAARDGWDELIGPMLDSLLAEPAHDGASMGA